MSTEWSEKIHRNCPKCGVGICGDHIDAFLNHRSSDKESQATATARHTKTPYHVIPDATQQTILCSIGAERGDGHTVAENVKDTDAAFIVAACNSSTYLRDALQTIIDCWGLGQSPEAFVRQVAPFMEEARAALKLTNEK